MDTATGTAASSAFMGFPFNMRVRTFTVEIRTAGTVGATAAARLLYVGTSVQGFTGTALTTGTATQTLGNLVFGTASAPQVLTSTDVDALLVAGGVLCIGLNDNTAVVKTVLEAYLDPNASWTGPPGS